MRCRGFITDRTALGLLLSTGLVVTALAAGVPSLHAQTEPGPPPDASSYVLHAYANLVQIPTLILTTGLSPLPPLTREEVDISLDSGPLFHPTHLRREGSDPIDLAILLDLSGPVAYDLQSAFSRSIADFTARSLGPDDRISVYVRDCLFLRSAHNLSSADGRVIERSVIEALQFPEVHGHAIDVPGCAKSNHLWNTLALIAGSLNDSHRRRVILAITSGVDHKSNVKWDQLKRFADTNSIAVFGLYPEPAPRTPAPKENQQFLHALGGNGQLTDSLKAFDTSDMENPFNSLCQLTGGVVLPTSRLQLGADLAHMMDLVRNRYILEFPRPDARKRGEHEINVSLSEERAFIRPSGISYPLPDPESLTDPTTIPSPPSPAVFGKRHPLDHPQ